ncbi:dihydropteroate synthase [Pseudorhodoplanes sinuspersici]|uniref:Dihydropteroate synthase n=1 Tax=Pseudorhodoplanes sinuspersici TaxID=1235591 RepID=A0A1W6ZU92_9HYPH|nr:dihydropteroate synthase [Pseudorhodoplanes sinuspersici]ARQ00900.1 dihydropteroate synthase [Pseudorhodoplanes sinuspersici]RKE72524.1 dihydropteroate synthase [Pseudorhodoplanes sinuspersici]
MTNPIADAAQSPLLDRLLSPKRATVMGVLNLTPDSFSDGGRFIDPLLAITHAKRMIAEGADIIDVGAESTRPYGGMAPVTAQIERERLEPVLSAVVALGKPVSIDTMKAEVADWAIGQGAAIANDVWGLHRDPDMAPVVARHGVPVIVMHNRETADPAIDIIADMNAFFERSLDIAAKAGLRREQIVLDPGIGFGKVPEQSIIAVAQLHKFKHFGLPILIGLSRKRFIASIVPSEPDQRLGGSIAGHLLAVQAGATIVRTHDVAETMQALRVAEAIRDAQ